MRRVFFVPFFFVSVVWLAESARKLVSARSGTAAAE
jgi:hypothetical protein